MNFERIQYYISMLMKRTDVLLATVLMMVVFMMILPLPTPLVDVLIACNLGIAAILLMVGIYIKSPLALSAFPSILLITTIYRLALGITTTRLILLQADAGEIVATFGNYVVQGNLIVGIVIFLIITIVQFIVITKGSERVAEVSARFSLDAMPGKQMSIDGDMRAGVIDMNEAKRRRGIIEKESQLYGSMDGAMKFVKGDAIAGLIIIVVNMIGGVSIGTLMHGMQVGEALQTYAILTIGDGLISQIPALFISITAGVIVTRVTTDESENLGTDIGNQILGQPNALLLGGVILLIFAVVPGMPELVFIPLGLLAAGLGYAMLRAKKLAATAPGADGVSTMSPDGGSTGPDGKPAKEGDDFVLTVPLMVDVHPSCQKEVKPEMLNTELKRIRRALYFDLGVPFPGIHLRFNEELEPNQYNILVQEVPIASGFMKVGHVFIREAKEELDALGIQYVEDTEFLPGIQTLWAPSSQKPALKKANIQHMELVQVLTFHLSFVLKKYAEEFLGMQEVRALLAQMESQYSELIKEVQRVLPIQKITEIFQRLVSEDISIRNMRAVLGALIEWGQKEKDTVMLTEYVRSALKRYISYKYSIGNNILPAYLLTPDVEDTVRNAIRQTSSGSYLALEPKDSQQILENIKAAVGDLSKQAQKPVLITAMDIRRYIRKMIETDLYDLPVISYQELTSEINIQPIEKIAL